MKLRKWWLAATALGLLTPLLSSANEPLKKKGCDNDRDDPANCRQVAVGEGGSAALYLAGVGVTCLGAMFLRSRLAKPRLS